MHSSETGHVRVLQGNKGNDCSHKSCRTRALNAAYAFEAQVETLYSNDVEQACTSILRMYYNREVSTFTCSCATAQGNDLDVDLAVYSSAASDPNTYNADMVQGYQADEYGFSDSIELHYASKPGYGANYSNLREVQARAEATPWETGTYASSHPSSPTAPTAPHYTYM
ncbi:hypothetical protein B484DRAFT_399341 [Ochromonadaceae sp. CCMP2298]|nr:hypothetical protein B484DRAFT_399341 [Ochromonadaceae sp. CCMP2298]